MTSIVNFPDFLTDPSGTRVGTTLDWDGVDAVGGYFDSAADSYLIDGDADAEADQRLRLRALIRIDSIKVGSVIALGGEAAGGEYAALVLQTSTDDQLEEFHLHMFDGVSTLKIEATLATPLAITSATYLRAEWEHRYDSGFSNHRIILRKADGTLLVDASGTVAIPADLTKWGVYGYETVATGTEAYLTHLVVDTGFWVDGLTISYEMIEEELGSIARMETSTYHETRRSGQLDRWIEAERDYLLEVCGLDEDDFVTMTNATAAQLRRRASIFQEAILFRVCARILMKADANRSSAEIKRYRDDIAAYTQLSDRRALHIQRLFHPDSEAETEWDMTGDREYVWSSYPRRPVDEEE